LELNFNSGSRKNARKFRSLDGVENSHHDSTAAAAAAIKIIVIVVIITPTNKLQYARAAFNSLLSTAHTKDEASHLHTCERW
jgi:hypothetical protein